MTLFWAVAALALYLTLRGGLLLAQPFGRARLVAAVSRLWRWEFWPPAVFYAPLVPWIAWLALRQRGLTLPTASNPAIPHGGFVGESKYAILCNLPAERVVPSALLSAGEPADRVARLRLIAERRGWPLPLVLKPDAGQRGAGVKLLRGWDAAECYFVEHPGAVLVQTYDPGPLEAGIFYYRFPPARAGEPARRGRIFSMTDKVFPRVVGDGRSSLEALIWGDPRLRMQAEVFLARLGPRAGEVPAAGESVALAAAGNHCQGTLFRDGGRLITAELEAAIEACVRGFEGFCFGRFDVRYSSEDALRAGRGFRIVELNGATSESTNIYDPSWPLWRAYATLFAQWRILYQVGAANRERGVRPTPLRVLIRETARYYRTRRVQLIAD